MSRVLSHTPAWLTRPSSGFQAFQPSEKPRASLALSNGYGKKLDHNGPLRIIAHRGTEIFFVVGNELRWSDLIWLKDAGEDAQGLREHLRGESHAQNGDKSQGDVARYSRLLKVPVAGQIRQLVLSPLGDYLAIATSHTVHIAVVPTRLDSTDGGPVKLRTFQLGPTAHVLEQASVASLLWHPFGQLGSCIVTVTTDACVRLWELNRESRHSFDEPALALDLKKLANATSSGEDLRASVYGTSKGFSPDSVEMEVAAACFGGIGAGEEDGWAPMTLWVAMREGDVYALCPLLPSKWQPAMSTIPSLSTSVVSKANILAAVRTAPELERRIANQQQKWLSDIDSQEAAFTQVPGSFESVETYSRPINPPAIPKLQGPFRLSPEPDLEDVTDIIAFAPRVDDDSLLEEDEDEWEESAGKPGLSITVLCLATQSGKIYTCLDMNGVEAQWLPSKRAAFQRPTEFDQDVSDLLVLETIDLHSGSQASSNAWPIITPNISHRYLHEQPLYNQHPAGRYAFLVSSGNGVYSCTLTPWLTNLEDELSAPNDTGVSFRIGLLYESEKTGTDQIIKIAGEESTQPSACVSLIDSDLGHFVLTISDNQPYAAVLDLPSSQSLYDTFSPDAAPLALPASEVREAYQPSSAFFKSSSLPQFLISLTQANPRLRREDLRSQIRLSPATLQVLTESHRILSDETNSLGLAASELFIRCQRMKSELVEQIRKVREISDRVDMITSGDKPSSFDDDSGESSEPRDVDGRIANAKSRASDLQQRIDRLRRRMAGMNAKEMSRREEAWAEEVQNLDSSLETDREFGVGSLQARFEAVRKLNSELLARTKEAGNGSADGEERDGDGDDEQRDFRRSKRASLVPADFRKERLRQVMGLLERETALVDAVTDRLARLGGLST